MNFVDLLGTGENPNGVVAQTANGTIINGRGGDGSEWRGKMADGPRWNTDPREEAPLMVEPGIVRVSSHVRRKGR